MKFTLSRTILFTALIAMASCSELTNLLSPDTNAPVITLNGESTVEIEQFSNYIELGANATDDTDGLVNVNISGEVNTDIAGIYIITYMSEDSKGNETTLTRTVSVIDTTKPVISLVGDSEITLELGDAYNELGATTELDSNIVITGEVEDSKVGTFTIMYYAVDSSDNVSETIQRSVNIEDTTAPVLDLVGDAHVIMYASDQYVDQGIRVDEHSLYEIKTNTINLKEAGSYTLTYTVTDSSNNQAVIMRTFEIKEDYAPVISFTNNDEIELLQGVDTDFDPTLLASAFDEKDGEIVIEIQGEVDPYVAGIYQLLFLATDSENQTTQSEINITVLDNPFISTWKTDNEGASENNQITIPVNTEGFPNGYNFTVQWGDGQTDTAITENITHTYAIAGTYQITITGSFPHLYHGHALTSDAKKLLSVDQWGGNRWESMSHSFYGASNLTILTDEAPILISVTDMNVMFHGANNFNQDLSHWDVSQVTNMSGLFSGTETFNQDLSAWDFSNVTNMSAMFASTRAFNQNLNDWDVSNVEDMQSMFIDAQGFNGDVSGWDVSSVKNMSEMFRVAINFNRDIEIWDVSSVTDMSKMFNGATRFDQPLNDWNTTNVINMDSMFLQATNYDQPLNNWDVSTVENMNLLFMFASSFDQDLNNWDVSKVTQMPQIFNYATSFNGDISNWDVSNVESFNGMFSSATNFNQDLSMWDTSSATDFILMFTQAAKFDQNLSNWDISNVTDMYAMFAQVTLSTENYDALLNSWSTQIPLEDVDFHGGFSQYTRDSLAQTARNSLTDTYNWTITDGGPAVAAP